MRAKRHLSNRIRNLLLLVCFAAGGIWLFSLIPTFRRAVAATSNPTDFMGSLFYMLWNGRTLFGKGVKTTVIIALVGTAVAFVLAVLLTFLRIQTPGRGDSPLVLTLKQLGCGFARIYVAVVRGTPMMVQALIFYYAGFGLFRSTGMSIAEVSKIWSFFLSGLLTVSFNSTAYLSEVLRGGIESVDPGQGEAARSLGMSTWKTMLLVIFPQAVKNSIPAIGNEFIINIKDSSVLSVIGCYDLMFATTSVAGIYYKALPVYCIAAVIYLILTLFSSLIMKLIAKRMDAVAAPLPSSN